MTNISVANERCKYIMVTHGSGCRWLRGLQVGKLTGRELRGFVEGGGHGNRCVKASLATTDI